MRVCTRTKGGEKSEWRVEGEGVRDENRSKQNGKEDENCFHPFSALYYLCINIDPMSKNDGKICTVYLSEIRFEMFIKNLSHNNVFKLKVFSMLYKRNCFIFCEIL